MFLIAADIMIDDQTNRTAEDAMHHLRASHLHLFRAAPWDPWNGEILTIHERFNVDKRLQEIEQGEIVKFQPHGLTKKEEDAIRWHLIRKGQIAKGEKDPRTCIYEEDSKSKGLRKLETAGIIPKGVLPEITEFEKMIVHKKVGVLFNQVKENFKTMRSFEWIRDDYMKDMTTAQKELFLREWDKQLNQKLHLLPNYLRQDIMERRVQALKSKPTKTLSNPAQKPVGFMFPSPLPHPAKPFSTRPLSSNPFQTDITRFQPKAIDFSGISRIKDEGVVTATTELMRQPTEPSFGERLGTVQLTQSLQPEYDGGIGRKLSDIQTASTLGGRLRASYETPLLTPYL